MLNRARRHAGAEAGFTLIELLVAMAMSMVVMLALTLILRQVIGDSSTTLARVSSTQSTRLALAALENELHSACVGTGSSQNLAPIQPGSDQNTLIFLSYTGSALNPTPVWHEVSFANGALTDTSYGVTGSFGNWSKDTSKPSTQRTLLSNAAAVDSKPIFQYFAYRAYAGPGTDAYWTIPDGANMLPTGTTPDAAPQDTPLTTASGSAAASTTVEVLVTLQGGPQGSSPSRTLTPGTTDSTTDAISLRLSAPPDEAPATSTGSYGPCE